MANLTHHADRELHRLKARIYSELARITTGLLVGVLALMTFLLSVGLQHPKTTIEVSVYASFVTLGLGLLAYVWVALAESRHLSKSAVLVDLKKEELDKAHAEADKALKNLQLARQVQVVLFVLSVIAIVAFAIFSIQLFFPKSTSVGA